MMDLWANSRPLCTKIGNLAADDYLLMGQILVQNAIGFMKILEEYYLVLSQKVNLLKSTIYFSSRTLIQL